MSQPDTVVFDLGGVLIDWNPRYLYRKLFPGREAEMERFLAEICSSEWNEQQDAGRSWAEATALLTERHPEQAELIEAYRARWHEMLNGPIPGTVEVLAELRQARTPLYALTNWSHETFPIARELYDFLGWFDGIVVSGETRMIKPDPRIFQHTIERFGLDPQRTVYVDDNPKNVRAAAALGMHGLHFTEAQRLRRDLEGLGLLSPET